MILDILEKLLHFNYNTITLFSCNFAKMGKGKAISLGIRRAKLARYQMIVDEYNQWKQLDIPTATIHRKHIKPKFGISLRTLNNVLGCNIKKELREMEDARTRSQDNF